MKLTEFGHTTCLSSTSLWILGPALLAYRASLNMNALLFVIACSMSMVHWTWYKIYSIRFWLDILCANVSLFYHVAGNGMKTPTTIELIVVASGSCIAFYTACSYPLGSWQGLMSHVTFRYFCYWGMMLCYIAFNVTAWIFNTILYLISIYAAITYPSHVYWVNLATILLVYFTT